MTDAAPRTSTRAGEVGRRGFDTDCYFAGLPDGDLHVPYRQSKNSKIELYVPYVRSLPVL